MTNMLTIVCPPKLSKGSHSEDSDERCVWEAVNIAMTGKLTDDCPPCTHPALHSLIMKVNDTVSDDERHRVWPYALRALGTKDRDSVEIAMTCADMAVRVFAADAMDAAGLPDEAAKLRALDPITTGSAAGSAWSAGSAAGSAAESAAGSAWSAESAWSAGGSARSAAGSARSAWSAESAAGSESAARSAAGSARSAWSAAGSARSAAGSAFVLLDALLPA